MFYGLAAALGWGTADLLAALSGRRIGALLTNLVAQASALVALALFGLLFHVWREPTGAQVAILLANGLVAALAYSTLYKGLELGPVALVSPIVGAYAAITILLSVVVLGETLGGFALAGTLATLAGVVLASTDLRQLRRGAGLRDAGIPFALVSMAGFGVAAFIVGALARDTGWFVPVFLSRVGNVAAVAAFAVLFRGRFDGRPPPRRLAFAAGVGLADVAATSMFALGADLGLVSVTAAASAAFILIPVFGGLLLFGERPALSQGAGVVLVGTGLVLLGLAQ